MTKIKNKKMYLIYIIIFAIVSLVFKAISIKAEETVVVEPEEIDQVFEVEINKNPNFEEVKNQVLMDDVKYVAHPETLKKDVSLSEIVSSDIDYSSQEVQQVEIEVQRFTDSKIDKTKIDSVNKVVNIKFVDTTAPKVTIKKDSVTIMEGEQLNLEDYLVSVTDNSFDKVALDIEEDIDTDKPGNYSAVYTATDSSDNTSSETLTVIVKAEPKPEPEPVPVSTKSPTATVSVADTSNGSTYKPNRVTRYGFDCLGCSVNSSGYSGTASGIKVGADKVLQSNGEWKSGYTYDGYHIVATSPSIPMFSILKISNHPFSGGGIVAGQPFYAIVGDRGVGGTDLDLFSGTERSLGVSQVGNPGATNTIVEIVSYGG